MGSDTPTVSLDGRLVAETEARVSVLDRGFLYGDGVFETLRTYGGVPFAEREHLQRLARSCELVGIDMPVGEDRLSAEIHEAIAAAGHPECYVRVMITRGASALSFDPDTAGSATRLVLVAPLSPRGAHLDRDGVAVALVRGGAPPPPGAPGAGAKATSYQANLLSAHEAHRRGAHEALLIGADGQVLEGASSNVFVVNERQLRTPPERAGILGGITRATVLGIAHIEQLAVERSPLFPADIYGADEVFVTSTLREVVPVVEADGCPIADGTPGPVTRRLHAAYRAVTGASRV